MHSKFNYQFYSDNLQEYLDTDTYDLENQWGKDDDFYLSEAKKINGDILDLGCGTGRLTIAIKELGKSIIGVDISQEMLDKAKLSSKHLNIKWLEGDCKFINLNKQFDLILMTSHVFQHMLTNEDQNLLFKNVHRHLKPNGLFIFDNRNLSHKNYGTHKEFKFKRKYQNLQQEIVEVYISTHYNKSTQIDQVKIKRVNKSSKEENVKEINLRYTTIENLNNRLIKNKLKIVSQYGSWDKQKFKDNSDEIITICKKI